MESNAPKSIHILVTESELYLVDEIIAQMEKWHNAFKIGEIFEVPREDAESIAEFEAYLHRKFRTNEDMTEDDAEF